MWEQAGCHVRSLPRRLDVSTVVVLRFQVFWDVVLCYFLMFCRNVSKLFEGCKINSSWTTHQLKMKVLHSYRTSRSPNLSTRCHVNPHLLQKLTLSAQKQLEISATCMCTVTCWATLQQIIPILKFIIMRNINYSKYVNNILGYC